MQQKKMTIEVPAPLHKQLKAKAVDETKTIREVLIDLITKWVSK